MVFKAIKLNSNWDPVDIISWEDAFSFCYVEPKGGNVLWSYPEEHKIRSQYCEWAYPAIIAVNGYRTARLKKVKRPSLKAILSRDMYICQYCGKLLDTKTGTRDHVIPESKGGLWTWQNLVSSCKRCQNVKADRLPAECKMFPVNQPVEPSFYTKFRNSILQSSAYNRSIWNEGFKHLGMEEIK